MNREQLRLEVEKAVARKRLEQLKVASQPTVSKPIVVTTDDWENKLREDVGEPNGPSHKSNLLTVGLGIVVLILILICIFAWMFPDKFGSLIHGSTSDQTNPVASREVDNNKSEKFDSERAYNNLKAAVDRLSEQSHHDLLEVQKKVWLLAIANDENAAVARKTTNNNEYISIGDDWKINRKPTNITYGDRASKALDKLIR